MKLSKISVAAEDYLKVKEICNKKGLSFAKIFTLLSDYLVENENIFFPEEVSTKKNLTEQDLNEIAKVVTKQINRLIGFIKKQDENIYDIRQDIHRRTKQILLKVIPEEEQVFSESHPLFGDYEEIINTLKLLLIKRGIDKANFNENIEMEIKKELGERTLEKYIESTDRVVKKHFLSE